MGQKHRNRWIGAGAVLVTLLTAIASSLYWFAPGYTYRMARWVERYRAGLDVKRVNVDGFEIPYLIGGEGPPLVLLHGFGARRLGSAIPGAKVVVLEETGHLPMMERPVESAAALLAFHGIEDDID